jgi:hypothetical protein
MRVEETKQVGRHLFPQCLDLFSDELGIERHAVHQLQWPRSNAQARLRPSQSSTAVDEPAKANVGEGTTDVGENLDRSHTSSRLSYAPSAGDATGSAGPRFGNGRTPTTSRTISPMGSPSARSDHRFRTGDQDRCQALSALLDGRRQDFELAYRGPWSVGPGGRQANSQPVSSAPWSLAHEDAYELVSLRSAVLGPMPARCSR